MEEESYLRFEKLLKLKGLTAYKVAKATGVTTATITHWKNGKYVPKSDKLGKIADFLGVTEIYLRTGKESAEKPEIPEYDKETMELIILFSKLKKEQKSAILNMMRSFALEN